MATRDKYHVWKATEEKFIRKCYKKGVYYGILKYIADHLKLPVTKVMNHVRVMKKEGRL